MLKKIVSPKLSPSQMETYQKLRAGIHDTDVAARVERRQGKAQGGPVASPVDIDPHFHVDGPVQLLRDVAGTAYRAGQQGTILALHNLPVKSASPARALKAVKVVAEVLVNETLYDNTVSLADLKALA